MKKKYPKEYCNCDWNIKMKGKKRDLRGKPVTPVYGSKWLGVWNCNLCGKNIMWS